MNRTTEIETNQFIFKPYYSNIVKDFDIFRISVNQECCGKDEKVKYFLGAYLVDSVELNAKSVLYSYGNKMFCLYSKGYMTSLKLKTIIEKNNRDIIVDVKDVNVTNPYDIYESELLQLLCNSLNNQGMDSYHNIGGKLYYLTDGSIKKDRNGNPSKINAFQIEISSPMKKDRSLLMYNVSATVFNTLKNLKKYIHKKDDLEKILKAPRYVIDENGNFRRVLNCDNKYTDDQIFVSKSINSRDRGKSSFISFDNSKNFLESKMGVVYTFLRDIEENLDSYFTLEKKTIKNIYTLKKKSSNLVYKKDEEYFGKFAQKELNVIDKVNSNQSRCFVEELTKSFRDFGVNMIQISDDIIPNDYNLIIIHDKDYYEERGIEDLYSSRIDAQHLILENYVEEDGKNVINKAVIRKIIFELLIKEDIKNRKISLYNWNEFNSTVSYAQVKFVQEEGEKDKIPYFKILDIHVDGNLEYREVCAKDERYGELFSYVEKYKKIHVKKTELLYIIYDSQNIILLADNNIFTVPNLEEINKVLSNFSKDKLLKKEKLIDLLNNFKMDDSDYCDSIDIIISKIEASDKLNFTYEEIVNNQKLNYKNYIEPLIKLSGKFGKDFVEFVYKNYDIVLNPCLKSKDSDSMLSSALTNINTYTDESDSRYKDFIYYFVGKKHSITNFSLDKACHIKKIISLSSDDSFIESIINQLNVDFVRLGEHTVYPFPIKYLNEIIQLKK